MIKVEIIRRLCTICLNFSSTRTKKSKLKNRNRKKKQNTKRKKQRKPYGNSKKKINRIYIPCFSK